MRKEIVRVTDNYIDYTGEGMSGFKAVVLRREEGSVLVGFPLESSLGWYDSAYTTEYRCWWIGQGYLESVTTITRSKFK